MISNADKILREVGTDAVLTEAEDLRYYLTGFQSSFGYVLTDKFGSTFYTDARYLEAAKTKLAGTGINVEQYKGDVLNYLKNYKSLALSLKKTYAPEYEKFKAAGFEIVDSSPAFEKVMAIKSEAEIENISAACKITDNAFSSLLQRIKEGMTENEVAAELEYLMRKGGASGTSFSTIVAFEENSSVPHHETGLKKLKFGNVILIDFGCKVNGYCSDCTRTFLFGDDGKHEEFKKTYEIVLKAQTAVKEQVKSGYSGKQADAVARDYFAKFAQDKYFTHSLGHGIGINVHEFPYLSPKSEGILSDGMVFSNEPGLYYEGNFGIRIEDTVCLKNGKAVTLTNTDKNLTIL